MVFVILETYLILQSDQPNIIQLFLNLKRCLTKSIFFFIIYTVLSKNFYFYLYILHCLWVWATLYYIFRVVKALEKLLLWIQNTIFIFPYRVKLTRLWIIKPKLFFSARMCLYWNFFLCDRDSIGVKIILICFDFNILLRVTIVDINCSKS